MEVLLTQRRAPCPACGGRPRGPVRADGLPRGMHLPHNLFRLYNKESMLKFLLNRDSVSASQLAIVGHVRGLKVYTSRDICLMLLMGVMTGCQGAAVDAQHGRGRHSICVSSHGAADERHIQVCDCMLHTSTGVDV